MKKIFILNFLLLFFLYNVQSQVKIEKRDYIWLMGYGDTEPEGGTTIINFNYSPPKVYRSEKTAKDDIGLANTSICNKDGHLLFYSNGCHIEDSTFNILDGSLTLNPGDQERFCEIRDVGYRVQESILILPYPNDSTRFGVFHIGSDSKPSTAWYSWQWLSYSEILTNRKGKKDTMSIKNKIIANDSVYYGALAACRNGNGRDWWIISPKENSNSFNICAFTPQGVNLVKKQKIGDILDQSSDGQACFSPDGTKYIHYNTYNGIRIFDFDRCTGTLSNYRYIPKFTTIYSEGGNAISPNSRFLYVTKSQELWQFDLWAEDIGKSRELIATKDTTFTNPGFFQEFKGFYNCRLGPDGKIYICGKGSHRYWNVIHQPNEKGKACDFRQHDIKLPTWSFASIPNFPHYRLYDKAGSICDTLGINDPTSIEEISKLVAHKIYPNPTTGQLTVEIDKSDFKNLTLLIVNSLGNILLQEKLDANKTQIDLNTLPNGTYFYQLIADDKIVARGKVIKIE